MANTSNQANKTEFLAFAASVRALRGQRSQREIAEIAGISPSTVARAERGGEIYVGHALAIAKALGRTLDEMMQMEWDTCPHCGGSGVTRKFADDNDDDDRLTVRMPVTMNVPIGQIKSPGPDLAASIERALQSS